MAEKTIRNDSNRSRKNIYMKTIKIPKGEFNLFFERGEKQTTITDEILMSFISDGVANMAKLIPIEREFKEPLTYKEVYDDDNPDYIKSSQEEI